MQDVQGEYPSCFPSLTPLHPHPHPLLLVARLGLGVHQHYLPSHLAAQSVRALFINKGSRWESGRGGETTLALHWSFSVPLLGGHWSGAEGIARWLVHAPQIFVPLIGQTEIIPVYKLGGIS